jgi:hypothetical protein
MGVPPMDTEENHGQDALATLFGTFCTFVKEDGTVESFLPQRGSVIPPGVGAQRLPQDWRLKKSTLKGCVP